MNVVTVYYAPTVLGDFGISWSSDRLLATFLPGDSRMTAAVRREDAPRWVLRLAEEVARHLSGDLQIFSDLVLPFAELPPFRRRVLQALRAIPTGKTATYGEVATSLGSPGASRAVGQAVARNPYPLVVPCHRVLAAGGRVGGFSAPGGTATKLVLLAIESRETAGPLVTVTRQPQE